MQKDLEYWSINDRRIRYFKYFLDMSSSENIMVSSPNFPHKYDEALGISITDEIVWYKK